MDLVIFVLAAVVFLMFLATFFGYAIRGWPEPTRLGKAYLKAFLFMLAAFVVIVLGGSIFLFAACLTFRT